MSVTSPVIATSCATGMWRERTDKCRYHCDSRRGTVLRHGSFGNVNVYILGLVEIGGYAVLARDLTDVAERGLGGFLHNVAELTGEFKLARAVKHSRFDLKHIAAVLGVRQPVHDTDKILVVYLFGHYLACAEIGCDVSLVYR